MSKDVTIRDVQKAIATIDAFAEQEDLCPEWAACLVKELASLLEQLLSARGYIIGYDE